jgi:hypothetical protein
MDPTVVVHNLRTDSICRLNETKFKYSFKTKTFFKVSSIKHWYDKYQSKDNILCFKSSCWLNKFSKRALTKNGN